ncbi:hypothetical protein EGW08_003193 [Elysia chlorotica]|uniref:SOCS box domain-containing protein n=1 Tax=Elysia chlorotica TaxID=188477 RepID=A0A3S0ZYA2_ELYCH|nr:hypothetical protein EGW08_003193 [Elysia chlorotica]
MELRAQEKHYRLSDRLIRAISHWQLTDKDDDIEELIDAGADINRVHGTLLPLHCACMVGDSEVVTLLLEKGAKVDAVDGYGRTAIHYAAERDEICLEILLEHGASIDSGDGNKDTALHWASYKNNVPCVSLLLCHGANVNARDFNNDTPVSWAACKGNLDVIRILLDYNADPDIRSFLGSTALQRSIAVQVSGLNTAQDNECLLLLVRASGRLDLGQREQPRSAALGSHVNAVLTNLRPIFRNARSLLDLCRRQIRRSLGQVYLPKVVQSLPIPSSLQEFILLREDTALLELESLN